LFGESHNIMKRYFSLYILLFISLALCAQGIQVSAPSTVSVGENFRVEYHIASDDISEIRFNGSLADGINEIAGPYYSTQSSFQIVNGHSSSSSSTRITYVFNAEKAGNYVIPAICIRVGGKNLQSRPHQVKVVGNGNANQDPQGPPRMHQQPQQSHGNQYSSPAPATNGDVFIRVSANKNSVVEQEPVKLTYKIYAAAPVSIPNRFVIPNGQDFTIHDISTKVTEKTRETINGKTYEVLVLGQYIVYPNSTGKLTIPGSNYEVYRQVRHHIDPFEEFFNSGASYHEEEMTIQIPSLTIDVQKLPEPKPANFSGGVGSLNMSASIAKTEVKAGEPVSITVRVSGTGNLKLLKQPTINFPTDFDVYDPKVTDKTNNTANGVEGSMIYEYIAVPQNKGSFTIPPIEFSYYDSQSGGYKTIKSNAFNLKVAEADPSSAYSAEAYQEQLRNSDIYSIKQFSDVSYRNSDDFFLSAWYLVILVMLLLAFFVLLFVFRKRAIERADVVRMKAKSANKVATKRLRKAGVLMNSNKKDEFYDEVLRALWGYAADKINIPVESLSKDNIQEKLLDRGCNTYSVEKFTDAISECEYARYAPSQDEKSSMMNTYEMAISAITEIEESLKTIQKSSSNLLLIITLLALSTMTSANAATTVETANTSYQTGNYQQAITLYEQALKVGDSPELYYNLGNAYYRSNNITKAILNYEKAYIYDPSDADVKHNLDFVRTKTTDKLIPANDIFLVSWYKNLVYCTTIYGWAIFSIIMIIISLAALLSYLFTNNDILRKCSFWLMLLTFVLFILSIVFALHQTFYINHNDGAIITVKEVHMKKSPEQGSETISTIHEGTHIDIIDDGMKEWKEIELPDGKTGWITTGTYTMIVEKKKD